MASTNTLDDLISRVDDLDLNLDEDVNDVALGIGKLDINSSEDSQDDPEEPDSSVESTDLDNNPPDLKKPSQKPQQKKANCSTLLDRHNRAIAQILSHFRNMVMAATAPISQSGNILELAALNRMTMETESAALISEIQGLLAINREIKALWIRGPLRQPGESDTREAELDKQAADVARLYDRAIEMREASIRQQNAAKAGGDLSASS
ncbi:putative mediator of rna polymerase ii transcription subunit 22 protein [Daldinia childiae]|uniref:putative mediator of rna polymerase ii transcription subunit 22 protein n=1 Tax=Daldinia childiae TaxID=326645 RepID=UPI001447789D|nr:putative mediator of rna polymerase ii transcription subunit 22 protein [Daldinia childiae]KAF3059437.1 putative mediator of rna polymerase ii transcription subunit 22 protein [Daldinia childiae]